MRRYVMTAARRRALRKAQLASAAARRGRHRSLSTGHTYGKGKSGRKNTRRALYGSRRHGISPAQSLRRRQRATKWKNRGRAAASVVTTGAAIYGALPQHQKAKVNAKATHYAKTAKKKAQYGASTVALGAFALHEKNKKRKRRR